jgi:hypothetical protein
MCNHVSYRQNLIYMPEHLHLTPPYSTPTPQLHISSLHTPTLSQIPSLTPLSLPRLPPLVLPLVLNRPNPPLDRRELNIILLPYLSHKQRVALEPEVAVCVVARDVAARGMRDGDMTRWRDGMNRARGTGRRRWTNRTSGGRWGECLGRRRRRSPNDVCW